MKHKFCAFLALISAIRGQTFAFAKTTLDKSVAPLVGGNLAGFSGSPVDVEITGGTAVAFSNITLTFGGGAISHFGTNLFTVWSRSGRTENGKRVKQLYGPASCKRRGGLTSRSGANKQGGILALVLRQWQSKAWLRRSQTRRYRRIERRAILIGETQQY